MTAPVPTTLDRLMRSFRALVREEFPRLTFLGIYEYSVSSAGSNTADLKLIDTSIGLPDMVSVPLRLPGSTATLAVGAKAIVAFVNGDPGRPFVLTADNVTTLAIGQAASTMTLAAGVAGIARAGDPVQAGPYLGTIVSGSSKVTCG